MRPRAVTIAAPTASPQARIDSLSSEGRGVARIAGKTVFIDGALPGEDVAFRYIKRRGGHDEGVATALLLASPERVAPRCAHFGLCGGCSLQHLAPEAQLRHKEGVLMGAARAYRRPPPGAPARARRRRALGLPASCPPPRQVRREEGRGTDRVHGAARPAGRGASLLRGAAPERRPGPARSARPSSGSSVLRATSPRSRWRPGIRGRPWSFAI